jgi:hypothetical protein
MDENTIKYAGARSRSCFFYYFRLQWVKILQNIALYIYIYKYIYMYT